MIRAKWSLCAIASAAFALGAPLSAQSEGAAPSELTAETQAQAQAEAQVPSQQAPQTLPGTMTPDQLIVFFTLFSESEETEKLLGSAIDQMLQKGERIDDWQSQGIDILSELGAREGGLEGNFLRDVDDQVLAVTDLSGTANPDLSGFTSYALRPDPVGLVAERGYASFIPGVWFEIAMQRSQKGKSLCYGGYFGVTLHTARPYSEWSQDEVVAIATLFALTDRISALEVCMIYDKGTDGQFMTRAVLADGTDLPAMNAEPDPSVVMASAELSAFLQRNAALMGSE